MNIINLLKKNKRPARHSLEAGMTYIELIVVLSIFASLSTVVIFNYTEFQSRVDIKNLSNDIALKIVEAQKFSISGRLPPSPQLDDVTPTWRPSYGIYIDPATDNKSFIFFTDLNQDGEFDDYLCTGSGECLAPPITITKGNTISGLSYYNRGNSTPFTLDDLTIAFIRPSGSTILRSTTPAFIPSNVDYVQISVLSPKGATANIKIYPSGNIDLK